MNNIPYVGDKLAANLTSMEIQGVVRECGVEEEEAFVLKRL